MDKSEIGYIRSLNLLSEKEVVESFYSTSTFKQSGNFFTNKRIASYWIDRDKSKNSINYAFYKDVVSIKPVYKVGITYCPYILVRCSKGRAFRVYVDGDEKTIKSFFNEAVDAWRDNKVERKTGFEPAAFSLGN